MSCRCCRISCRFKES